jgi:MFS family permease
MKDNNNNWNTDYEWKVVTLLAIGFGLVGLDRWIISTLWPSMSEELGLAPELIGSLAGYTGIAWGIFAIICGRISDKVGHRKVIIPAIILFSLMGGFSGMAGGLVSLVIIRTFMGMMEGAYTPTSFTAVAVASKPSRRGLNQGIQQCGFALTGFAIAPIVASQLLAAGISWHTIFWIAAIPGFIVAMLLIKILKEPNETEGAALLGAGDQQKTKWLDALKSSNIIVCMIALFCAMSCVFVMGAMVPVYLTNILNLSTTEMGIVASAVGFGGFLGQFGWPGLSDKFGRKPIAILGFVGATLSVWWFMQIHSGIVALFVPLFIVAFFCLGNVALISGPISTESARPGMLAATIGIVVGAGEIFGGGIAPIIAGNFASTYGLQNVMYVPLAGVALGIIVAMFFKETAPIKLVSPIHNATA